MSFELEVKLAAEFNPEAVQKENYSRRGPARVYPALALRIDLASSERSTGHEEEQYGAQIREHLY